jgi:hypothetical protein
MAAEGKKVGLRLDRRYFQELTPEGADRVAGRRRRVLRALDILTLEVLWTPGRWGREDLRLAAIGVPPHGSEYT